MVGRDPDLGGLDPERLRSDTLLFESDADGFPSGAIVRRLKPCLVGRENVGLRPKTIEVDSAVLEFQSASVGILSRVVGILSNVVGIQSAKVGFQSAACRFRTATAGSRETADVSLDSARGDLASPAGFFDAPDVASRWDNQ